jgi:hypothetical protein
MWTTWLVYLIVFMGSLTFGSGALGLWFLLVAEEVVALRYLAMMIALMSGGLSMIAMAQCLRMLLLIVRACSVSLS